MHIRQKRLGVVLVGGFDSNIPLSRQENKNAGLHPQKTQMWKRLNRVLRKKQPQTFFADINDTLRHSYCFGSDKF